MADETFDSDQDFSSNLNLQDALTVSLEFQSLSLSAADTSQAGPSAEGPSSTEGESSSASPSTIYQSYDAAEVFRLYFKGLVEGEKSGIGVAIYDARGKTIFRAQKPLVGVGMDQLHADMAALIEGLNAALSLGLQRVLLCCDSPITHALISRKWTPKLRKVALLIDQATSLQNAFVVSDLRLLSRDEINPAIKVAREAMETPTENSLAEASSLKNSPTETCTICYQDKKLIQIFSVKPCGHRYCVSCMRHHVEYRVGVGLPPNCPDEKCTYMLDYSSCKEFLTPKFLHIMSEREREATIPVEEKVYCPNPRCSFLMSRAEVSEYSRKYHVNVEQPFERKCVECEGLFCLNCNVPWHGGMSCEDFIRLNPDHKDDETKLKGLASDNLWSQCKKCNLLIESTGGCYRMKCRCGFEFCYNCEAEWKDRKARCSCSRLG